MRNEWLIVNKKKLSPLHTKIHCIKFDLNWSSGSGEVKEIVESLQQRRWTKDKL